mmetsp:Transcript_145095/g.404247  ORF Transcript_145095/g.404247 Transcript_145095/m.404247 type:complete len:1306 (-) Transcript_145095:182-4099(-)|eukprot:CAMPEP_0179046084 /NCGR_PEP_ID=MMETSP0796-20121207/18508_1 /TAXON_ID=73915 /ORGANISM="Pyrodinium bahamense, Strain pbaha01" /LENGTH=1305 /DNA_ID=CAMNT_0020742505 /DNA_START=64 /DNA_END=3981 /DNA_ORIENTATION=-
MAPPSVATTKASDPLAIACGSNAEPACSGCACHISVLRGADAKGEDATLMRCILRGDLPKDGPKRHKVLVVVLDRSGSMAGAMWRRVVEAVVSVVNDALLADPHVSLALVVYADQAQEIWLPCSAAELQELLLSREYAPQGGTCFKSAFELAWRVVKRELQQQLDAGASPRNVDLAALVFTDGEDTSVKGRTGEYGVRLVDKEASAAAARRAGDSFREALSGTGCSTYVCMAAFGSGHDPDQCQYLSDRYYFINRGEVLAEVLAGGLGALLSSAGQCSLRLKLPPGVALEEMLPESLPLDAGGCLNHHVWLRVDEGSDGPLDVAVEVAGAVALHGSASLGTAGLAAEGSFEQHLFLIDLVALQLRRVAREICGKRPSAEELTGLRARLTDAKDRLQPTKDAASTATGHLRGRAALRERLAEVEAARERLSYALGQFDERDTNDQRTISTVAIDAILRDAGQHVPQGPMAAALARRVELAGELPVPEALSQYGSEFTTDSFSCCNAQELAGQGDALFFQLGGVRPAPGGGFFSADDGDGLVSHESFVLLSRGGKQGIKCPESEEAFTHLGLPLYATEGHFLRTRLLLPEVMQRLTCDGVYQPGITERQLLGLLGRSLAKGPAKSERQIVALLHKARAVHAVMAVTVDSAGRSLLDTVVEEVACFVEDPVARAAAQDLYAIAAAGLLAEGWEPARLAQLGERLSEECLRRRITHALRGADNAQCLCLAWSLLGSPDCSDKWLDQELSCSDARELRLDAKDFDPFAAPAQLEALEGQSPACWAPRASGAAALVSILSSKRTDSSPPPGQWGMIRQQLSTWASAMQAHGGAGALWRSLDALMTEEGAEHREAMDRLVTALRLPPQRKCLRAAFPDAAAVAAVAATACLPDLGGEQPLRLGVAAALRAVVERRTELVRKYPIIGAEFPRLDAHTAETVGEVWGAPANPVDPALHHKAMLRVWRRTMKVGLKTTVKEALADKEYRRRGGRFAFPSPLDTFVRGLHRRTADLHRDWRERLRRDTAGDEARREAVAEMLLRLRWDDNDDRARAKLSHIVARIWDGLEGVDLSGRPPLSSALWLDSGDSLATETRTGSADIAPFPTGKPGEPATKEGSPGALAAEGSTCSAPEPELQPAPASDGVPVPERRVARDGRAYTRSEFLEHYGEDWGRTRWEEAGAGAERAAEEAADQGDDGAPAQASRAEAARAAMDAGLQAALDGLSAELRRHMDTFLENQRPGSKMKLPLGLKAKQRKAVHLWAEMQGLEHRSFGYRGRRRLHLSVSGSREDAEGAIDYADWSEGDAGSAYESES